MRIRTIKPEFWSDGKTARELSRDQRLFYIGLWNVADDEGRFRVNVRSLLGDVFPHDEDLHGGFIEASLRVLADTGRLVMYVIDGERFGQLLHFMEHQRINRATPSRIPPPPKDLPNPHGALSEPSVSPQEMFHAGSRKGNLEREREQGELPPPEGGEAEPGAALTSVGWRSTDTGSWTGSNVVGAYVEYCRSKGWPDPPPSDRAKQGAVGKRLAMKNPPATIIQAMVGMGTIFPHCPPRNEPWDLFDLERKFTKAHAAVMNDPKLQEAAFDEAFLGRAS